MQKQIRDIDRLLDIEEFADLIVKYTASINEEQFLKDEILQWGLLKALENIGEAARQISEGTREEFPALGWQNMISARHFYVHEYFAIKWGRIWETLVSINFKEIKVTAGEIAKTLKIRYSI